MLRVSPSRPRRSQGFSLFEALVALALLGIVLLMTMSLIAQQPAIERRLAAHHEALRAMEITLELLRATATRPTTQLVDMGTLPERSTTEEMRVFVEVESALGPNLYEVRVHSQYSVGGQTYERTLETLMFAP